MHAWWIDYFEYESIVCRKEKGWGSTDKFPLSLSELFWGIG